MKLKAVLLGLVGILGTGCKEEIKYITQPNEISVPVYELDENKLNDDVVYGKAEFKGNSITFYEFDRNKDGKEDLAELNIDMKTEGREMRQLIDDKDFDGLADHVIIDNFDGKGNYGIPDGNYDMKVGSGWICTGIFKKEANDKNIEFGRFLEDYVIHLLNGLERIDPGEK